MRIITTVFSIIALLAVAGMSIGSQPDSSASRPAPASGQDTTFLGQRINMLEQRLNLIESSIRTLDQQISTQRSVAPQPNRNPDTAVLQSEIEVLRSLVRELQCGLVHVDERTLSAAAKEARKRMKADPTDPCRLMPETPVQLTSVR
jgi:hypothetical protein